MTSTDNNQAMDKVLLALSIKNNREVNELIRQGKVLYDNKKKHRVYMHKKGQ